VHNGIIENYESLRSELSAQGYVFTSDTDTESIAHLMQSILKSEPDLFTAVRLACQRLVGAYAIAVIDHAQPGRIVVAREGSPCCSAFPTPATTPLPMPRPCSRSPATWSIWRTATSPN
jgi:glucosamine 6-phosphate synthetase-like amidotransferase/phosphosugar isomerase protein